MKLCILWLMLALPAVAQIQGGDFNGPLAPGKFPPKDSNGSVMQISILRVWDSGQKWGQINTASGVYNWTQMDSIVNGLPSTVGLTGPMDIEYTFGYTPKWAGVCSSAADPSTCLPGPSVACNGTNTGACGFGGGTQCANPSNYSCLPPVDTDSGTCTSANTSGCGLGTDANLQAFTSTLATRYGTKIKYYGLCNECDSPNFWCQQGGTVPCGGGNSGTSANTVALKRLLRMSWDEYNITKCANPASIMIGVGGHVGTMSGPANFWYENYNATTLNAPAGNVGSCHWAAKTITGKDTYDWPNEHMRGQGACTAGTFNGTSNCDPTSVIPAYTAMQAMLTHDGLSARPICNDEYGWNGSTQAGTTDNQAAYVAIENILQSSFSSPKITCMVWYTYDAGQGPLLNAPGGLAWDVAYGWTHNITGTIGNFTKSGTIYTVPGTTNTGTPFLMAWDMSQNCNSGCTTLSHNFGSGYTKYIDLAGSSHNITGGLGTVLLGLKPVQVLQTAATLALAVNAGNNQTGTVSTTLPVALSVLATSNGTPQAGVSVSFSDAAAGGSFGTSPATTNGSGIASSTYTLPSSAKTATITASSSGYSPTTFTETSIAVAHVLSIAVSTGNNQIGNLGTLLPTALSVVATDNGTPVTGLTLTFSDAAAGGSFGTPSPTTNGSGMASTTYTLPSSAKVVTISVTAATYNPASFTETAAAQNVAPNLGNNQTGSTGTTLPTALQALVTIDGTPVNGLLVAFADGGAGGTFGSSAGITNSSGLVSTTYTLPATPQVVTVSAGASGFTSGTFTETAATQALSILGGNGQAGANGTQLVLPLTVMALLNGVPTAGISISFNDVAAGGSFGTSPCITDVSGACSTTYTLPITPQSISINATATGYSGAVFSETSFTPVQNNGAIHTPGTHVNNALTN